LACERGFATTLKLFKTPVVRQYFHKGILWRASGAEEVQSFELFIDLLFVGIIAVIGDVTAEDPTGGSLLRFIITFTLSWKIWWVFLSPLVSSWGMEEEKS
jgi:low temperature requirement protein LtrA